MQIMTNLQSKLAQLNKTKLFCKDLYPGDWWIDTSHERESFGVQILMGNVKDHDHFFQVFIDSDFNVSIEGSLLYHGCDAWVEISSNEQEIGFEIETVIEDDNYLEKLRKDLTRSIPKILEMVNVISEFAEQYKEAVEN